MLIGYARVSTVEQEAGLDAQLRDLAAAGCRSTYTEQASAVGTRPVLEDVIDRIANTDVLVVTKLDRLARNVEHLCQIVRRIEERGASLRILGMGLDTKTPTGKLMLNVLGSVAQFEREMMLERQKEGIAKAKAEGKYQGRKPRVDPAKVRQHFAASLHARTTGEAAEITAEALGLSVRQVYRHLAAADVT